MCGITGIYNFNKENIVDIDQLRKMNNLIQHRGPDEEGFYHNENIGFGHRRLSIIDLKTGAQPMYSNDKTKVLVFNGEIYNYVALREELKLLGYQFHTISDTEVILKAYEAWGVNCQTKFNGMWAFMIWDTQRHSLFISRDRLGIKPLYYCKKGNSMYLSSEVKAFTAVLSIEINKEEAWDRLVFGPLFSFKTMYKDIYELLPGQYMFIEHNKVEIKSYFNLFDTFNENTAKYNSDYIEYLLNDSIKLELMSDVSIGTINSGGLDSSLISSIATGFYEGKLKTFSVAPNKINNQVMPGDESYYAEKIADSIRSKHNTIRYDQSEFIKDIASATYFNDDILFHSNSIPLSFMMREIKNSHKTSVVLGGEGADEVFRGYSINKFANLYYKTPNRVKKYLLKLFESKIHNLSMAIKFFPKVSPYLQLSIARNSHLSASTANDLLGFEGRPSDERIEYITKTSDLQSINQLIYYEQGNYLKGLLHRVDRMSMRWSVEARVPFLDHRIVEYLNSISFLAKSSISESSVKKILKKIASSYIDNEIINRKKYGFASPANNYKYEIENNIANINLNLENISTSELFIVLSFLEQTK